MKSVAYVGVVVAVILIISGVYLYLPSTHPTPANTTSSSTSSSSSTASSTQGTQSPSYALLLTDPPYSPAGTEHLNFTYSGTAVQTTSPNGTTSWIHAKSSGTVDLMSLVNVTQTVAITVVPAGSVVHAVQITVTGVKAEINGSVQTVSIISNNITISVSHQSAVGLNGQTGSGAVVDLTPSLTQVQVVNASSGSRSSAYVFVPSGVALGDQQVQQNETSVGARASIHASLASDLETLRASSAQSLEVTSASLSGTGNQTSFSVTVKNTGNSTVGLFGMVLSGEFNMSLGAGFCPTNLGVCAGATVDITHSSAIPMVVNGTSISPLLGFSQSAQGSESGTTIAAGQSVTLTFSGVISVQTGSHSSSTPTITLSPVSGQTYSILLMGDGSTTAQATAS